MPRGNPKPQTVATEKYTKKVGIVAKIYKLKKTLADEFADACERAGTNQSAQMSKMMKEFIEKVNNE